MKNYSYQAAAIRHFLPVVEKDDPDGTIAQNYREALHTIEYLARRQDLQRELRLLDVDYHDLKILSETIL